MRSAQLEQAAAVDSSTLLLSLLRVSFMLQREREEEEKFVYARLTSIEFASIEEGGERKEMCL